MIKNNLPGAELTAQQAADQSNNQLQKYPPITITKPIRCKYCDLQAVFSVSGIVVCEEHIANAVNSIIDGRNK